MSKRLVRTAARLACAGLFFFCCAWDAEGHKIIAKIAYDHLTPKTKAAVDEILNGKTLAEFAVWPDQVIDEPGWAWTKPWHYVDMADGETEFKMDRDCGKEGCVVQGILRYSAELASSGTGKDERGIALRFLASFVGDVHQPLHVGHKKDRGGTTINVQFFGRPTSLHAIWDDALVKRKGLEYKVYATRLEKAITPEKQRVFLAMMDPVAWATESHHLAEKFAYIDSSGRAIKSGAVLADEYANRCERIVDEQMTKAGLRLGQMLNTIYDPGAEMPDPPPLDAPKATSSATAPNTETPALSHPRHK